MRTTASMAPRRLQFFMVILQFDKIYCFDILLSVAACDRWKSYFVAIVIPVLGKLKYSNITVFPYGVRFVVLLALVSIRSLVVSATSSLNLYRQVLDGRIVLCCE
jgi:hypothetical protein